MQELINKIAAEAGITPEQAEKSARTVATYLKSKTPHVFHEQLDTLMNGGTISDGLKKKFNDLKDELEDAAKNFGQRAEDLAGDVGKKINEVFGKKS
jgi:hypothetical protein